MTVKSCESVSVPSLTVTTNEYNALVSKSGASRNVNTPVDESISKSSEPN